MSTTIQFCSDNIYLYKIQTECNALEREPQHIQVFGAVHKCPLQQARITLVKGNEIRCAKDDPMLSMLIYILFFTYHTYQSTNECLLYPLLLVLALQISMVHSMPHTLTR